MEYEAPSDIMQPSAQHIPPSWLPHVPFSTFSVPPPEVGYYEAIAKEAESVFHTEEDFWNLQSLDKLSRTDSAIRESMRRTPHSGRGMMKEVVHPNDVTLPDGQKIPLGVWLGVSKLGIGHDERYYPDPHKYDPFRFSRARTEIALMETNGKNDNTDYAATTTTTTTMDKVVGNEKNSVDVDYSKEQVIGKFNGTGDHNPKLNCSWLSTVAEDFGVFGLGRHSCPGRWFASQVMKITLAYIALNYEIQPINGRPPSTIIGHFIIPPQKVMIKVRKRRTLV